MLPTPWKDEDFEQLFDRLFDGGAIWRRPWRNGHAMPLVDVRDADGGVVVEAELPGLKAKEIEVKVAEGVLTIRGERKHAKDEKTRTYHRTERAWGRFERAITLPPGVDCDQAQAEFVDGVLKVTIPMKAGAQAKSVAVREG